MVQPDGLSIKRLRSNRFRKSFLKQDWNRIKAVHYIPCGSNDDKCGKQSAEILEEPSQDTIAILITEQLHRILDTIVSRCQVLPFQPLQPKAIEERLIEQEVSPHIPALSKYDK